MIRTHRVQRLIQFNIEVGHVQRGELELGGSAVRQRDGVCVDLRHVEAHHARVLLQRRIHVFNDHTEVADPGIGQEGALPRRTIAQTKYRDSHDAERDHDSMHAASEALCRP